MRIERVSLKLWGEKLLDSFLFLKVAEITYIDNIRKTDVHRKICNSEPRSHHEKKTEINFTAKAHRMQTTLHLLWKIPTGIHPLSWLVERSQSFCISQTANWPIEGWKFVSALTSLLPWFKIHYKQKNQCKTPKPKSRPHSITSTYKNILTDRPPCYPPLYAYKPCTLLAIGQTLVHYHGEYSV